jgi:sugar phosphate permease
MVDGFNGGIAGIGAFLALQIVPRIFHWTGSWQMAISTISIVPILALIGSVIWLFGPKAPVDNTAIHNMEINNAAMANSMKQVFRMPVTYVIILIVICVNWVYPALLDLVPGYLAINPPAGLGYGPAVSGQVVSYGQLAWLVGSLVVAFIVQKIFRGKISLVITISFIVAAILVLALRVPFVHGSVLNLGILMVVLIFFLSLVPPALIGFVVINYPRDIVGRLGGILMAIPLFAGAVAITTGAMALRSTGTYHLTMIIISSVAIIGALVAGFGLKYPKSSNANAPGLDKVPTKN